jgi:membrane protease YdiL (CAAX protease family)
VNETAEPSAQSTQPDSATTTQRWSVGRLVGSVLLIMIIFFASQMVGVIALAILEALRDPAFDAGEWVRQSSTNGAALVAASLSSTLICVPLVLALAGGAQSRRRFLRIHATSARTMLVWCGVLIAFVAASDLLTLALGRPVVPDVMVESFSSANPFLLFIVLSLCAPLFEELFFRGFLFSGLEAAGARNWVPVVTTAALWSMLHLQYDFYGIASIFVMGLLLGTARRSTDSIVPCIVMHGIANAIAYVETAIRAGAAG